MNPNNRRAVLKNQNILLTNSMEITRLNCFLNSHKLIKGVFLGTGVDLQEKMLAFSYRYALWRKIQ